MFEKFGITFLLILVMLAFAIPSSMAKTAAPQIVQSGSQVESFLFPSQYAPSYIDSSTTVGPDGSVYSIARGNVFLKVGPDGTNTLIPIVTNNSGARQRGTTILYSNGYLWLSAFEGYIRIRPDGSEGLFHQQPFDSAPTAGPDGVYFPAPPQCTYDFQTRLQTCFGAIERIGLDFKKTYFPIGKPVTSPYVDAAAAGSMVFGPDNTLYFQYFAADRNLHTYPYGQLGKLSRTGLVTISASRNLCGDAALFANGATSKFVYQRGNIYFIGEVPAPNAGYDFSLCKIDATGNYKTLISNLPYADRYIVGSITADKEGNIWIGDLLGKGLYAYNTANGTTSGPYAPSLIPSAGDTLFTGPDDNIYFFSLNTTLHRELVNAYVQHLETLAPTAIGLSSAPSATDLYVSESIFSGPYTAVSLNPAVATVTPASSLVGRFNVARSGAGSTTIKITDVYGNVRYEPVSVTM